MEFMPNLERIKLPGNETPEHFMLKQIAATWLRTCCQCSVVGIEVVDMNQVTPETHKDIQQWMRNTKHVADVVGLRRKWTGLDAINTFDVRCVEAKVSLSDIRNGYCLGADLCYLITPKGLIAPDKLYPGLGLLEVEFDKVKWSSGGSFLRGVTVTKRPRRMKNLAYRNGNRRAWEQSILYAVANSASTDLIYKNPWFWPGYGWRKD